MKGPEDPVGWSASVEDLPQPRRLGLAPNSELKSLMSYWWSAASSWGRAPVILWVSVLIAASEMADKCCELAVEAYN